jgi:hypothetical protein
MAYPYLTASDLEARVRTYLNEATADFFTQTQIYNWLSLAAREIAQKATCVRRILNAVTTGSEKRVATNCYKVFHVEYIPASGRKVMLTKIDPLRVGHYPMNGTQPQYWYEWSVTNEGGEYQFIGIDPTPYAVYNLRLYVCDLPKIIHTTYPITSWGTGWTAATPADWTLGTTAAFSATAGTTLTWDTATTASVNYTLTFTVSNLSNVVLTPQVGGTDGQYITTNGFYQVNILAWAGTSLVFSPHVSSGTGTVTIDNLCISKEANLSSSTDRYELDAQWSRLIALYATMFGLIRDGRTGAAAMLGSLYKNEVNYLRQLNVEVIPDGKNSLIYR